MINFSWKCTIFHNVASSSVLYSARLEMEIRHWKWKGRKFWLYHDQVSIEEAGHLLKGQHETTWSKKSDKIHRESFYQIFQACLRVTISQMRRLKVWKVNHLATVTKWVNWKFRSNWILNFSRSNVERLLWKIVGQSCHLQNI